MVVRLDEMKNYLRVDYEDDDLLLRMRTMSIVKMIEIDGKQVAFRASAAIPDTPEEWLDEFQTFSIYQVLPKIIELWGLNVKTDVEAKKNFMQQSGK